MDGAAERWARDLGAWAIPQRILDAAPEAPWGFPPKLFQAGAEHALAEPRPSQAIALEALPEGGSVLDVGAGAGAASLPLAPPAALLVAVDESAEMLAAFAQGAARRGAAHRVVCGRWPDVAEQAEPADVVVCHHVFYNVADLVPFARALTQHARRRVVVELTAEHPQAGLNAAWKALHDVERPTSPTASDAIAVLREMGLGVHHREAERPPPWEGVHRAEHVAFARRRLCVGPERDAEIDAVLGSDRSPRRIVTMWWEH